MILYCLNVAAEVQLVISTSQAGDLLLVLCRGLDEADFPARSHPSGAN